MNNNAHAFLSMYRDLLLGSKVSPRGSPILEVEDYQLVLDMRESVFTSFKARCLNVRYARAEFLWYMRGDPFDTFIEQFASMWPKIKQPTGFYYSNYGQYLFTEGQVGWVVNELFRDKDSRRASIILLRPIHIFADNKDMVCTYSLNFRIRKDRLNMSVNMRSNDAIFGTTNDVFSFAMVYEIVYAFLKFARYGNIERGLYVHKVDSLHIYERHWDMAANIISEGMHGYYDVPVPRINTLDEAKAMADYHLSYRDSRVWPVSWELMSWLHTDLL